MENGRFAFLSQFGCMLRGNVRCSSN